MNKDNKNIKIILASTSPRRRELIKLLGCEFTCISVDTDETTTITDPASVVMELSARKAKAAAEITPEFSFSTTDDITDNIEEVIIGADTIVACDGEIMGKPKDHEDAFRMIRKISGKDHSVFTGVTMIWKSGKILSFAEETKVTVADLTDEEITNYIATGEPFDKAGSYAIQGLFAVHIEKIHGDYNNVVGFPVARIYKELKYL